jgi:hypothetical protein
MVDSEPTHAHRHKGDGVELDVRAEGTSVSLTLAPTAGDALTIVLSADQAGELGAWLVAHKARVDLPPGP